MSSRSSCWRLSTPCWRSASGTNAGCVRIPDTTCGSSCDSATAQPHRNRTRRVAAVAPRAPSPWRSPPVQTRRQFVTSAGSAAAAAVFAPQALAAGLTSAKKAPLLRGGRFSDGLMSGDPTPNGITLLTRIDDVERSGGVLLEVARDKSFKNVVTRKTIRTSADLNHSVKARVTGLKAYEQYYYRFATSSEDSEVGRFRTGLPADSRETL